MSHRTGFTHKRMDFRLIVAAAVAVALLGARPAHAVALITINAGSGSGTQGSTGDVFDVTLTNTTTSTQNITGFYFAITVPIASGITFTDATDTTTTTYIFAGDSLFGPDIAVQPPNLPGTALEASDASASGVGNNVVPAATFGLGHVLFDIAPGAPLGPVTVTLVPTCNTPSSCTSLSDSTGANVSFSAVNGTITVQAGSPVPEPGTLMLMLLGLPAIVLTRRRSR